MTDVTMIISVLPSPAPLNLPPVLSPPTLLLGPSPFQSMCLLSFPNACNTCFHSSPPPSAPRPVNRAMPTGSCV